MNEYMKPDYEVMVFEANEYVSACYEIDVPANTSQSAGWCQATSGWYYDMNNTLSMDNDTEWKHEGSCNNNTFGSASYQIVAKDLVQVEYANQTYWGNSYQADNAGNDASYTKPSSIGAHNLYISFFHNGVRHAMMSNNFAGIVNQGTGSWSNHS